MFQDLGQFKAYISKIDSFDQLYIIQQGGRGMTREQVIAQLEKMIAKDAEDVCKANKRLWNSLKIRDGKELLKACKDKVLSLSKEFQDMIQITN